MIAQFLKNVSLLVAVNVAVKLVFLFGVDIGAQNYLGREDYGLYFVLLNFTLIFQVLTGFGMENYNQHQVGGSLGVARRLFPNLVAFKLVLGVVYGFVVCAVAYFLGYLQDHPRLLLLLILNQVFLGIVLYLRSNVTALGYYRMDSVFSALDKFLMVLFIAPMLWVEDFWWDLTIVRFVLAQTVALGLTALIIGIFVGWRLVPIRWELDWKYFRLIWRDGKYFALVVFLMYLYTRMDGVMIERFYTDGVSEAAIYVASYRLLEAVNMLGFLFASFLIPMFSDRSAAIQKQRQLLQFSYSLLLVIYCSVSFGAVMVASDLMDFLYDESYSYWSKVFTFLFPSCISWAFIYTSGAYLTARGVLRPQILLFCGGVLGNLILNWCLIPRYGALGAAYSTLATQMTMSIGVHLIALREGGIKVDFGVMRRWVLYFFGFLAVAKWASSWSFFWIWELVAFGAFGMGAAAVLGLISRDSLPVFHKR